MTIGELREILNNIPTWMDGLNVWIDSDESEGGRVVRDVQIKHAEDCELDWDDLTDEILCDEEVQRLLNIDEFPDKNSTDFYLNVVVPMIDMGYRWDYKDDKLAGIRFSKRILAIKF